MEQDIDLGELGERSWWNVPLPPCAHCGGDLLWYEAGYVSGTRRCMGKPVRIEEDPYVIDRSLRPKQFIYSQNNGCGAMFSVMVIDGHAVLHELRIEDGILK